MPPRILVVGGYGAFGARAAERLARTPGLEIVIAGRHGEKAREEAARIRQNAHATLASARLDGEAVTPSQLTALAPSVVINASGPFQTQDYTLAKACLAARCHYIDLADARGFVTGIGAFDREARQAGIAIISGASTVPGLSSAVVARLAPDFARLTCLDIAIAPGNSFDPGIATTRSILGGAGRPFPARVGGRRGTLHGWQGLHRLDFPGIGARWMGAVDVPDLDLFPARYPTLETVRVWAGLEVGLYHLGIWALAGLARARVIGSAAPLARPLLAVKRALRFLGTDEGGMLVTLAGQGHDGSARRASWALVAKRGHGPYIPAIAPVLLARRLARRETPLTGATACFELFRLEHFMAEISDLDIRATVT